MDKNTEVIHSLNQLIQGEYMSIHAFNIYISKIKDENVKHAFQDVQNQHRENIKNLAHYVQELGGQAHENIGFKGSMSDMKINMQTRSEIPASDYIKRAVEGMTKGIAMTENLLRGDLDAPSRALVGDVLHQDRMAMEQLSSLK